MLRSMNAIAVQEVFLSEYYYIGDKLYANACYGFRRGTKWTKFEVLSGNTL